MKRFISSWHHFSQDEGGTATIEFLFTFPIVISIFCASFESSFFMIRKVSLERSLDLVVRDLRIGSLGAISHWDLKREICERGAVLGDVDDCQQALQIELQPISTANFAMPAIPVTCRDRSVPIDPVVDPGPPADQYALGDGNQIMLMRVCLQADPMFKTTVFGVRMNTTGPDGGYSIITASTFVNEPRT
jgi:hypothetical protein